MNHTILKALSFVCFSTALSTTPVFAQLAPEIKWCINEGNSFSAELQIKGCTTLLNSGKGAADMRGEALQFRGEAYANKEQYAKAIADFSEAIKLKFKVDVMLFERGSVYVREKEYDNAIADYSRAIQLDNKVAEYFLERGRAYGLRGRFFSRDYKDAIADFDQAIKLDPKLAGAFYYRGALKKVMDNPAGGVADIAHACELDPQVGDECSRAKVLGSPGCSTVSGSASDPSAGGVLIANNLIFTAGDTIKASITGAGNTLTLKNDLIWPTITYQGPAEAISYRVPTSGSYKFSLDFSHPTTPYTAIWSCTPAVSAAPTNTDSTAK
jgi:tetratricopeptide (TPR) repeat protein